MSTVVFFNLNATSSYPQYGERENKQFDIIICSFLPWRNILSQVRIKYIIIRFNWSLSIHLNNGQVPFITSKIIFHYQSIWACLSKEPYQVIYYWWNQHTLLSPGHPSICGSQICGENGRIYEFTGNCISLLCLPLKPCYNYCHLHFLPFLFSFPWQASCPCLTLSLSPPTLDLIFPDRFVFISLMLRPLPA